MTTTELALPTDGDQAHWSEQERALVTAAGLVRTEKRGQQTTEYLADRPTVEAFLAHCRRTGLDPIARQIYAIYRGGKWGIQISIDGARLVAERTGTYEGQTPVEWTADGVTWTQVWLAADFPRAARVGVYRRGFREPLYAVATWDSYAVTKDEWSGGQKTGRQVVSDMWQKFGPLMLGKCAEMLALRKAFPQDLSGLYSTEEMAQAGVPVEVAPAVQRPAVAAVQPAGEPRDWAAEIEVADSMEALTALANEAQRVGAVGVRVGHAGDNDDGSPFTVWQLLVAKRDELQAVQPPLDVVVKESKAAPRQWVREARLKSSRAEVRLLLDQAEAENEPASVLDEILAVLDSMPAESTDESWAPVAESDGVE